MLVEHGGFARRIETHHQDSTLALAYVAQVAHELGEEDPHGEVADRVMTQLFFWRPIRVN